MNLIVCPTDWPRIAQQAEGAIAYFRERALQLRREADSMEGYAGAKLRQKARAYGEIVMEQRLALERARRELDGF